MFKYLQDVLLHRLWREKYINKSEAKKSRGTRFDVTKGKISINPKILAPAGNERHDVENSKEVMKIKRTYDTLMKKFVNPNLDLTPSGMKPFEYSKFQNFKRKYELLKSTLNSVLDKKSTRKLPPLPDSRESGQGENSLVPEELSLGWTGQVLDRRAGIARIEIASRPKDIHSAPVSFLEMEDEYSKKSKQSSDITKRTFKGINQRKPKKLSKHLNSEKPVDLVKEAAKSHILKVYEKNLQKQETEKEEKQTGISQNIGSFQAKETGTFHTKFPKYLETKQAVNLQKEENSNDKTLSIPLEFTTGNNVETSVQTFHDHKEYNKLENLGQHKINQVNSKLSNATGFNCKENCTDGDKLVPNRSKGFSNIGTIPSCNISNESINQETIDHTNMDVKEKNPLKSLQSIPLLINTSHSTSSCLRIHKKEPSKTPDTKVKPVTINKNKLLIKKSPKTPNNVHSYNSNVNKATTDIYSPSKNHSKIKEIKRNYKELEKTQIKANNKTFIVDKPQPISGGIIKYSVKDSISDRLFRRSKQKINSFSYNEIIPNENNGIKKQIVSDQSSTKVKSPKPPSLSSSCSITHRKTPAIQDHVLKRDLLNNQYNETVLMDVNKVITEKEKLNDETVLQHKITQNVIINKLGLKGLNGITEYKNEKEDRDVIDKNMHKGIEKPKENELTKNKSIITKQKINKQDILMDSISPSEGLSNNKKHKTTTTTLKSQQNQTDEVKSFNLQVRNEDIYGPVALNKKENYINCVEKLNENKLKGNSTILKSILLNKTTKHSENDSLYSTLLEKPDSNIYKSNLSKNMQNNLDPYQNNQEFNTSSINNNKPEIKTPNTLKSTRSDLKQFMIRKAALKSDESLDQVKRKNLCKLGKDKTYSENLENTNTVDTSYRKINIFKKSCESLSQVDNPETTKHNSVMPSLIQEPLVAKRKLNDHLTPSKKNIVVNSRQNSPASEGKSDLLGKANKNIVKDNSDTIDKTSNVLNFIDMTSFVSKHVKSEHVLNIPDLDSSKGRKLHSRKPESPKVFLKKYGENKQIHNLAEPDLRSLRSIQIVKKKSKNSKLVREKYSRVSTNSVKDNNRPTAQRTDVIIPSKMHTRNYFTIENKTNLAFNYLWKRYASTLNISNKTIVTANSKRNSQIKNNHDIPKHYHKKSKALTNTKKEGHNIEIQANKTKIQNKDLLKKNETIKKKPITIKSIQDPALIKLKEIKGDGDTKTISHTNLFRPKNNSLPLNGSQSVNKQCDIEILYKRQHKYKVYSEDNRGRKIQTEIIPKSSFQYDNNNNFTNSQCNIASTNSKHSSQNIKTNVQSARVKKVPAQERFEVKNVRSSSEISPSLGRKRTETTASIVKDNLKSPQSRNLYNHRHKSFTKLQQIQRKTEELPAIEQKFSERLLSKSQALSDEFNKNSKIQITSAKSDSSIKKKINNSEYSEANSKDLLKLNLGRDENISNKSLKWKSKIARLNDWTADDIAEEITTRKTQQIGKIQARKRTSIKSNISEIEQSVNTVKPGISRGNAHKNMEQIPINQSYQNGSKYLLEETTNNKKIFLSPEKNRPNDSETRMKFDKKEDGATYKTTLLRNDEKIINTSTAANSHSSSEISTKIKINSNDNNTNDFIATLKSEACKERRTNIDEKTSTGRIPLNITGTSINKKILIKRGEFKRNIDNFKTNNLEKITIKPSQPKEEKNDAFKGTVNTNNTISSLHDKMSTENIQPIDKSNFMNENKLKAKSSDQMINKTSPRIITSQSSHILDTLLKPVNKKSVDIPYRTLKNKQLEMSLSKPKKEEYEYLNKMVDYDMNKRSINLSKGSDVNKKIIITDNSNKSLSRNALKNFEPIKGYKETQENNQTNTRGIIAPNLKKPVQNSPRDQLHYTIKPILLEESKRFSLTNDEIRKLGSKVSSSGYKNLISSKINRNVQKTIMYQSERNLNAKHALNIYTKQNQQPTEKHRYLAEFPLKMNVPNQKLEGNSTSAKSDTSLSNTNMEILKKESIKVRNYKTFNTNQTRCDKVKSWRPQRSDTMIGRFPKETIHMNA
ncbi:uncharacterized protein MAL13P1.304-like [Homalodisca vitripennis]|uniref:uncharacterized protein MAL13P1.304-like n=1 Tax=Homalodisca vitripennis TaxID=197043 RepID=UPI001EEA37B6|nr:uncharacterized protein MAL13P1.304-like [Homalodisca vitripennis]